MAKVASRPLLPSNVIQFNGSGGGSVNAVKRKTPSELRGEQLKRRSIVDLVHESPEPSLDSLQHTNGGPCRPKIPDSSKNPRYLDTRMNDLFPVTKRSTRLSLLSRKENVEVNIPLKQTVSTKSSSFTSEQADEKTPRTSCTKVPLASTAKFKDESAKQFYSTIEKCSESTFRSVAQLSSGGQKLPDFSLDMDEAFKGLAAREPLVSTSPTASVDRNSHSMPTKFCSEFHIPGQRIPLDFALKTTMRLVSSSSVNWLHRLMTRGSCDLFNPQVGCSDDLKMPCLSSVSSITQVRFIFMGVPTGFLASCSHISIDLICSREYGFLVQTSSGLGGLISKSLLHASKEFCTAQFVVMFISGDGLTESKSMLNAYISQSTRGLRSLLKEHDICFSMPLCHSKVEQVTKEDLFELSEIEKHNLGQARRTASVSDVDNSPQSLLVFSGHENVHGVYDFLLNYRSFVTSLSGVDVPLLYSPVPFENAAFLAPEVRCKEVRRADNMSRPNKGPCISGEPNEGLSSDICYSVEIKDAYLPPWIISSVCDAIESDGSSFEASFVAEPTSTGLNVSLDNVCQKSEHQAEEECETLDRNKCAFRIPKTIISPQLRSAYLKGLKYCNGSYTASLSPVC